MYSQSYLDNFHHWLLDNRMAVSIAKSSVTLLTPHFRETDEHPTVSLNGEPLPLNKTPKILGLHFDPHMNFGYHSDKVSARAQSRINTLKALTGTQFGCQKETISHVYNQFVRPVMHYASPAFAPMMSAENMSKLQVVQNSALRIATGCVSSTPISHLHSETKTLPLREHTNMTGAQFLDSTSDPDHPLHHLYHPPRTPRNVWKAPATYYRELIDNLPAPPPDTTMKSHIHTHIVGAYCSEARNKNRLLQDSPPLIAPNEIALTRPQRVTLARLRCGMHPSLGEYRNKLDPTYPKQCPHCNRPRTYHNTPHLIVHCPHYHHQRSRWDITSLQDLWDRPVASAGFLGEIAWPPEVT